MRAFSGASMGCHRVHRGGGSPGRLTHACATRHRCACSSPGVGHFKAPRVRFWPRLFRPPTPGPISGAMDHPKNSDPFAPRRPGLKSIGDDVGQAYYRLLIGVRDASWTANRCAAETLGGCFDPLDNLQRSARIMRGNVGGELVHVVQRALGPNDIGHDFSFATRVTVARRRRIAVLWGMTRPACMSSNPSFIPSTIASSRSTKSVIASPAR